jgi:hypothetical protein
VKQLTAETRGTRACFSRPKVAGGKIEIGGGMTRALRQMQGFNIKTDNETDKGPGDKGALQSHPHTQQEEIKKMKDPKSSL